MLIGYLAADGRVTCHLGESSGGVRGNKPRGYLHLNVTVRVIKKKQLQWFSFNFDV